MSAIERRARRAIGCPFRAQGRDVEHGLDCVGLVIHALGIRDAPKPDYRLSSRDLRKFCELARKWCREVAVTDIRPGDVLLFAMPGGRAHLALKSSKGIIHADLKLRKVVETGGAPSWPVKAAFRRTSTIAKKAKI